MFLERIEGLFASLSDERTTSAVVRAGARRRSRAMTSRATATCASRRTPIFPQIRARMILLAGTLGWLSPADQRAELVRMIGDLLARGSDRSRRSRPDLLVEQGPRAGPGTPSPVAVARTGRRGGARRGAGVPGERRGPRPRSASADQPATTPKCRSPRFISGTGRSPTSSSFASSRAESRA